MGGWWAARQFDYYSGAVGAARVTLWAAEASSGALSLSAMDAWSREEDDRASAGEYIPSRSIHTRCTGKRGDRQQANLARLRICVRRHTVGLVVVSGA